MSAIRVNHGALDTAMGDLSRAVAAIDARMSELDAGLRPLRDDWSGHAQRGYHAAKQQWDTALEEMRQLLAETAAAVGLANDDYRAADLRGARSFDF